jgi:hypothetical protein
MLITLKGGLERDRFTSEGITFVCDNVFGFFEDQYVLGRVEWRNPIPIIHIIKIFGRPWTAK